MLVKNGARICGTGGALATAPLVQSKSYFEVKIQQAGQWSVGLATRRADLQRVRGGQDAESWCLGSDHAVLHDNKVVHVLEGGVLAGTMAGRGGVADAADAGDLGAKQPTTTSDVERLIDAASVETEQPHSRKNSALAAAAVDASLNVSSSSGDSGGGGGAPAEGDTLGIAFDHVELNFYLNGRKLEMPVLGVRGTVYPALFGE